MFKDTIFLLSLLVSVLFANGSQASSVYLEAQTGALMGVGHVSLGVGISERHFVSVGVGYVPKLSSHAEMSLYSFKYRYQNPASWNFELPNGAKFSVLPFNIGFTYLLGYDDALYFDLPDQYPSEYYAPTGKRIVFNYQPIVRLNTNLELYVDFSILDVGLIGYVREPDFFYENYDFLGLSGITTWGAGMRYQF